MESGGVEGVVKVVNLSLASIKWRLKPYAKRRLEIDILALCTGLRPVIMVDYGGKMPELQEHLCLFLRCSQKESSFLQPLRVMIIDEMIYLVHKGGMAELISSSISLQTKLKFVDLEHDPPKMLSHTLQNSVISGLVSIQNQFSSVIFADEKGSSLLSSEQNKSLEDTEHKDSSSSFESSDVIDLTRYMHDTQVTLPTLNGWLLGYPVVYLFGKDHIADAVFNLSTKSLHIFQIFIGSNQALGRGSCKEELMSFTVPYELSMEGKNEPWAEEFLHSMQAKYEKCKQAWEYLRMEVNQCYPQSIAL